MAATYRMPPPPPIGRAGTFPTGSGTYAWNGGTQQWTVLPSGTSQVYGWDGTSQSWVPVTGGGGTGMGVTDGSDAAPGQIGELVRAGTTGGVTSAPIVAAAPSTWVPVTSISLPAGDWDVTGAFQASTGVPLSSASAVILGEGQFSTSPSASVFLPGSGAGTSWGWYNYLDNELNYAEGAMPVIRCNATSTLTVYLIGTVAPSATEAGKTATFGGFIYARRVR